MEELKEYFTNFTHDSLDIFDYGKNHDKDTLNKRTKIVEWMLFVCKNLNFKNETAFKSVQIFDLYMSKVNRKIVTDNINDMQLSAVACLNLGCKLEEINCNYMSFLKEHLLDDIKNEKGSIYTLKDLARKEAEILTVLKYKLSSPSFYQFNNIFLQIAVQETVKFYSANAKSVEASNFPALNVLMFQLINCNDMITKHYTTMKESVFTSNMNSGLICFKTSLLVLSYFLGIDLTALNAAINKSIRMLIKDSQFLQKSDIIAFNLFTIMLQGQKFASLVPRVSSNGNSINNGNTKREESKEYFEEKRNTSNVVVNYVNDAVPMSIC